MTAKRGEALAFLYHLPDTDSCILWPFSTISNGMGYGKVMFERRVRTAHWVSFVLANGYEPSWRLRHTCKVARCVNPKHIEDLPVSLPLRFIQNVPETDDCVEWPFRNIDTHGYPNLTIDHRNYRGNRVSFYYANGRWPIGGYARHTCDNKLCVNPRHLIEGTFHDNIQDAIDRERYRHKLTEAQVAEIRASDENQYDLASRYGVSQSHISRIKSRRDRTGVVRGRAAPAAP